MTTPAIKSNPEQAQLHAFLRAVQTLAESLGLTAKDDSMPISKFKSY